MKYLKLYERFIYNKTLNPKFWDDFKFNERIREKLLTIATEFYDSFNYNVKIKDIYLTGSMCNYNYNNLSDLDVHVVIDFTKINEDTALVKTAIDGMRFIWNLRHNISIKGHDVEMYVQDVNEPLISSGVYSLLNNEWLIKPKYQPPQIDEELVDFKTKTYMSGIDEMEKIAEKECTPEEANLNYQYAKKYKDKIMKVRKAALEEGGEYVIENLIFKNLRNNDYLKKLIDVVNKFYDKIYSQS